MKDRFKMETSPDFTAWDLNCRHIIPHTKQRNQLERKFKRKARRKLKIFLKKCLTNSVECDNI